MSENVSNKRNIFIGVAIAILAFGAGASASGETVSGEPEVVTEYVTEVVTEVVTEPAEAGVSDACRDTISFAQDAIMLGAAVIEIQAEIIGSVPGLLDAVYQDDVDAIVAGGQAVIEANDKIDERTAEIKDVGAEFNAAREDCFA